MTKKELQVRLERLEYEVYRLKETEYGFKHGMPDMAHRSSFAVKAWLELSQEEKNACLDKREELRQERFALVQKEGWR